MPHAPSPRLVFIGLVLLAVVSMLFARLYLQAFLNLEACPLCMTQRVFVVAWGSIALIAALHNPLGWGSRVYAALCGLAACAGAAVAARHVWLQHLPEDQVPACGPSLDYMLENLPFEDTLSIVFAGDGNCANVSWSLLSFSIPEQTLAVFCAAILICLWQTVRRTPV
ncbi:disulfide bond formation protein B [Halioglobus sp. Uisw_031]|jgi:disulfide bond formation protein DsbB|uniref:disulfide bond formation protein B n=1 Tax=Halioglobus sp. Uisw_031 TaxID=3230977 RepID=UPI0039EA06BE